MPRSLIYSYIWSSSISTSNGRQNGKSKYSTISSYCKSISISSILLYSEIWISSSISISIVIYVVYIVLSSYIEIVCSFCYSTIISIGLTSTCRSRRTTTGTIETSISTACYLSYSTRVSTWDETPESIFSISISFKYE